MNYLYELLTMQNPQSEEELEYLDMNDIMDQLVKNAGNPEHLRKITSCRRAPSQFFCNDQRLLFPTQFKPLVRQFVRERKLQKNFKVIISHMIADTEFQNDANEILKIEHKAS